MEEVGERGEGCIRVPVWLCACAFVCAAGWAVCRLAVISLSERDGEFARVRACGRACACVCVSVLACACACACVRVRASVRPRVRVHACARACARVRACVSLYVCSLCVRACVHFHVRAWARADVCVCVRARARGVCVYVSVCVCARARSAGDAGGLGRPGAGRRPDPSRHPLGPDRGQRGGAPIAEASTH